MTSANPDLEAVAAHAAKAGGDPVVMINLMKFKSQDHAQRFLTESRARTGVFIRELGANIVFAGLAGPEFCADDDWDLVLLVQYPNFAAVERTLTGESIGPFIAELRESTVEESRFLLSSPMPLD
jgi:hypothetical protein